MAQTKLFRGLRLSRPDVDELLPAFAASLHDRMLAVPLQRRASSRRQQPGPAADLQSVLAGLTDQEQLEFSRRALNAALEALDAAPSTASRLLPRTESTVLARIAQACVGRTEAPEQPYVVAEVDLTVWRQLMAADQWTVPWPALDRAEVARRRALVLRDLGISETEVERYRGDLRVPAELTDRPDTPG